MMGKRRSKVNNNEDLSSHQLRSHRSSKMEFVDNEMALSDDVQPTLPPQGTVRVMLQRYTKTSHQQEQAGEPTLTSEQEHKVTEEEEEEPFCAKDAVGEAKERTGEEETTLVSLNENPDLMNLKLESLGNCKQGSEEEEETETQDYISSLSQTSADQPQMPQPTSQEEASGDGSCPSACEEGQCVCGGLKRKMENLRDSQQDPHNGCTGNSRPNKATEEAADEFPAKKRRRRRMGMCGPREKEKSSCLGTVNQEHEKSNTEGDQKRGEGVTGNKAETSRSRTEKDGMCGGGDTAIGLVMGEDTKPTCPSSSTAQSIPAGRATELRQEEKEPQTMEDSGEKPRSVTVKVQVSSSVSEEDSGGDPGCLTRGEDCLATPSTEPTTGKEQPDLGPLAGMNGCHDDPVVIGTWLELDGGVDENTVGEKEEIKQKKEREDMSEVSGCYPNTTSTTGTAVDARGESENQGEDLMDSMSGVEEGTVVKAGAAAEACAPFTDTEEFLETAAPSNGSEENGSCGPDDMSPGTIQHDQATPIPDSFGPDTLDFVTDSQLNNIVMIEEDVKRGGGDSHEDATDLVCGLIRELSSLNRTVMATHRELENMRRGNNGRRATRRRSWFGIGPRHSEI